MKVSLVFLIILLLLFASCDKEISVSSPDSELVNAVLNSTSNPSGLQGLVW